MNSVPPPRPARPFWLKTLPLILLPLLLALFGLIAWAALSGDVSRFDPAAWRAAQSDRQLREQRYEVLDDLRQNYLRFGTPRAQVLAWLGAPANTSGVSGSLTYPIGYGQYNASAGYSLQIIFDGQDRLIETRILE